MTRKSHAAAELSPDLRALTTRPLLRALPCREAIRRGRPQRQLRSSSSRFARRLRLCEALWPARNSSLLHSPDFIVLHANHEGQYAQFGPSAGKLLFGILSFRHGGGPGLFWPAMGVDRTFFGPPWGRTGLFLVAGDFFGVDPKKVSLFLCPKKVPRKARTAAGRWSCPKLFFRLRFPPDRRCPLPARTRTDDLS